MSPFCTVYGSPLQVRSVRRFKPLFQTIGKQGLFEIATRRYPNWRMHGSEFSIGGGGFWRLNWRFGQGTKTWAQSWKGDSLRFLTYGGLCLSTCIILQRSTTLAALVGLCVAAYISLAEYTLQDGDNNMNAFHPPTIVDKASWECLAWSNVLGYRFAGRRHRPWKDRVMTQDFMSSCLRVWMCARLRLCPLWIQLSPFYIQSSSIW